MGCQVYFCQLAKDPLFSSGVFNLTISVGSWSCQISFREGTTWGPLMIIYLNLILAGSAVSEVKNFRIFFYFFYFKLWFGVMLLYYSQVMATILLIVVNGSTFTPLVFIYVVKLLNCFSLLKTRWVVLISVLAIGMFEFFNGFPSNYNGCTWAK